MKHLSLFLLLSILPNVALCGVGGQVDKRKVIGWIGEKPSYVSADTKNQWNENQNNNVVRIFYMPRDVSDFEKYSSGTGSFISPRHILTNAHVAEGCGLLKGTPNCIIQTSEGDRLAKVVLYGGSTPDDSSETNKDWSILEIVDKDFCSEHYFGWNKKTVTQSGLWRAGFGGLRVLSNQDVKNIKDAYAKALYEKTKDEIDDLTLKDVKNFVNDAGATIMNTSQLYEMFLKNYKEITKNDFIKDCMTDDYTLKRIDNCEIRKETTEIQHNCQSWSGDSGSSIVQPGGYITMLHNSGEKLVASSEKFINSGVSIENINSKPKVHEIRNNAIEYCKNRKTTSNPGDFTTDVTDIRSVFNIGDPCYEKDLPPHATLGRYIEGGSKKLICRGVYCSCAAILCASGYYLVVNAKTGKSQGWCFRERKCPDGQHMNIIDGYKTDKTCVDNEPEINDDDADEEDVDDDEVPTTNDTPVNSGENTNTIKPTEPDGSANTSSSLNSDEKQKTSKGLSTAQVVALSALGVAAVSGGAVLLANVNNKSSSNAKAVKTNNKGSLSTSVKKTSVRDLSVGNECAKSDLPAYATAGQYIKFGAQKLSCANGVTCSCAATRCKPNYYLVVNAQGVSQGWCRSSSCPNGKQLHIIDGYKTDGCK